MADDNMLSMSLDEIIKLKRAGESSDSRNSGARGKVKPGIPRISAGRGQIRRRGAGLKAGFMNTRGRNWHQASDAVRGHPLRRPWNLNVNRQRQYHIELGRNKLQIAKRFLRHRQRGGGTRGMMVGRNPGQATRISWRGNGRWFRRGRIGVYNPRLMPNSFRSDQLLRFSRLHAYRNKLNRKSSAMRSNQEGVGPSLIVSIENERAGFGEVPTVRRMRRRRGGLTGTNQQSSGFGRASSVAYQQPNTLPYHTGVLDPEIQMLIAGIQGKVKPNGFGTINAGLRRGQAAGRGRGRIRRFGKSQSLNGSVENVRRLGLGRPLGITGNTLNERFGSLR